MITSTFFCISFLTLICFTNGIPINQISNEDLVEGDMIFPPGFNPKSSARGVAIAADARKWPNGVVPYDISAITESNERETILYAMNTLMYDVGTPIPNVDQRRACIYFRPRTAQDKVYLKIQYRRACIYFRPRTAQDKVYLKIQYGDGCLATVCHRLKIFIICVEYLICVCSLDILTIVSNRLWV